MADRRVKPKKVFVPIWDAYVYFFLGGDFKHVNVFANVELAKHERAGATFRHTTTLSHYIIWTKEKRDIVTLVHECVHAASAILEDRGVIADFRNDEAQAYLVHWLLENSGVRL